MMKYFYSKYWVIIVYAMIFSIYTYEQCACNEIKGKQMVTARIQDIPDKVQLIGRLGHPLGDLLTIKGKWFLSNDKGETLHFQVTLINGKELFEKVELNEAQIEKIFLNCQGRGPKPGESWDWKFELSGKTPPPKPADGETWEMLGIESGFYDSYSDEAAKEIALSTFQSPYYRGGFCTQFKYIAVKKINE